jgi:hypothetical protein
VRLVCFATNSTLKDHICSALISQVI